MFGAIDNGLEDSIKFYNQWIEEVKATVPKERLLIFNAKQGWKPLCEFLGVPVPANNQPFPHVSETAEFKVPIKCTRITIWGLS
jgi:hypothetical protein